MRQLYVMSEPNVGGFEENHLIGILTEENGNYTFQYKLNGKFPKNYLKIKEFPDAYKVYTGEITAAYIHRVTPKRNGTFVDLAIAEAGLTEYDEWEMVKFYGQRNEQRDSFLTEMIPEGAIIHEQL
jgi:hypothetical protein